MTREPGVTPLAEAIRALLLDASHAGMAETTELLLYAAARAQHVKDSIAPALAEGKVVICDRYIDSTSAYQGGGRALDQEHIDQLHRIATGNLFPNLTIVLDVPPEVGLARAAQTGKPDRFEREALDFHQRVRDRFLALAAQEPERIHIVDGAQDVETVEAAIRALVKPWVAAS